MSITIRKVAANTICNLVLKVADLPPRDTRMLANGSECMPTESLKDAVVLCRSGAFADDSAAKIASRRIGAALVFERLWTETGCGAVIEEVAGSRKHGFTLERAVFRQCGCLGSGGPPSQEHAH